MEQFFVLTAIVVMFVLLGVVLKFLERLVARSNQHIRTKKIGTERVEIIERTLLDWKRAGWDSEVQIALDRMGVER